MAALLGKKEAMERPWNWAKEKLTTGELNNKILANCYRRDCLACGGRL
jgi:endo-1,4-beta-D-glucanase Y